MTDGASARPDRSAGARLQIERVLADRTGASFRVKGRCMYPTVRAGDILRVRSCGVAAVSIGDIAVFRRFDHLFAHRVIGKCVIDGLPAIVTRPDGADSGADPPISDDNLLGTVTTIERSGKPVPLRPVAHPWLVRRYFDLRLALMHVGWLWLSRWTSAWRRAQDSAAYQRLASAWLVVARPRISYTVRVPLGAFENVVCRQMTPETFNSREDWRGRPIRRWILKLHVNGRHESAAEATLVRGSNDDWQIADVFLRPRYRGTPLKDALMAKAAEILRGAPLTMRAAKDAGHRAPASSATAADPRPFGG